MREGRKKVTIADFHPSICTVEKEMTPQVTKIACLLMLAGTMGLAAYESSNLGSDSSVSPTLTAASSVSPTASPSAAPITATPEATSSAVPTATVAQDKSMPLKEMVELAL